jgi:DNA-binding LacI/PurR family transcriptional regulator/predicted NBD/HSP70 family sugar kinase
MVVRAGGNSTSLRRENLTVVLTHVHERGSVTRSELVGLTGLSRNAVKSLVDELARLGLVAEQRPEAVLLPGRPSPVVRPDPGGPKVLAIDIQVDSIGLSRIGLGGLAERQVRLDRQRDRLSATETILDIEGALPLLDHAVGDVTGWSAVGVAVAGIVDASSGIVHVAHNLGWHDVPLAELIRDSLGRGIPLYMANDGSLGCMAEHVRGTGVGVDDLLYVSGEVGVSGGAIVSGRPLTGADGHGASWSHMMVNPDGHECRCGSNGCWETEIGELALLRRAGLESPHTGRVAVDELLRDANAGRRVALDAVLETGHWVAVGIANLAHVFNPRMVVLGGLLERLYPYVESTIAAELDRRLPAPMRQHLEIRPSRLGEDGPLVGAAELAIREHFVGRDGAFVEEGRGFAVFARSLAPQGETDGTASTRGILTAPPSTIPIDETFDARGNGADIDGRGNHSGSQARVPVAVDRRAGSNARVIGLLVQDLESPFITRVAQGVEQEASQRGYEVSIIETDARSATEARQAAEAAGQPMDGLVVVLAIEVEPLAQRLRTRGMPMVLLDHDRDVPGTTFVTSANRKGTITAIDHLISLGHERIGFITGTPGTGPARERLAGYRDSLLAAGIPYDRDLVVEGNFLESRGRAAAAGLLSLDVPPTAIFTSSDTAAFGALGAAREAGLSVPRDLSIVGFDDVPDAARVTPGLTTVRQDLLGMGSLAVKLLDRLINDTDSASLRVEVATELILRESTAPPRRTRVTGGEGSI